MDKRIEEIARQRAEAVHLVRNLTEQIERLQDICEHEWKDIRYRVACVKCGKKQHGWWCETSPDKVCHYTKYGEDSCDYCGHPEERK